VAAEGEKKPIFVFGCASQLFYHKKENFVATYYFNLIISQFVPSLPVL